MDSYSGRIVRHIYRAEKGDFAISQFRTNAEDSRPEEDMKIKGPVRKYNQSHEIVISGQWEHSEKYGATFLVSTACMFVPHENAWTLSGRPWRVSPRVSVCLTTRAASIRPFERGRWHSRLCNLKGIVTGEVLVIAGAASGLKGTQYGLPASTLNPEVVDYVASAPRLAARRRQADVKRACRSTPPVRD